MTGIANKKKMCLLSLALSLLASTGCGFDAYIEGIAYDNDFSVRDQNPAKRLTNTSGVTIIMSEEGNDQLRVVSLTIGDHLLSESQVDLGPKDKNMPFITVAEGELVEMVRSDGVRVVNTLDPVFVDGGEGILDLERDEEDLFGTFEVNLKDGGHLDGTFTIPLN